MIDEWGKGAKYWDEAWNPVIGCKKVSEGCLNCYAERFLKRFPALHGKDGVFSPHCTKKRFPNCGGVVFCGNMTDLFGEWNSDQQILSILCRIGIYKNTTCLLLTKRPERAEIFRTNGWFYPNVFYGITAETQARLEERCCRFFSHWISLEPLLERVDLTVDTCGLSVAESASWVVVGAESGKNRRPCSLDWVRQVVEQCREVGTPVFVKQLDIGGKLVTDINKFPADLQIRQLPWQQRFIW